MLRKEQQSIAFVNESEEPKQFFGTELWNPNSNETMKRQLKNICI